MKITKFWPVAFAVVSIVAIWGCGKDSSTPASLIAKWNLSSVKYHSYTATRDTTVTVPAQTGDYLDFRTDNKLYISSDSLFGGKDTSTYVISGNYLIVDGADTITIQNLTTKSVALFQKRYDSIGSPYFFETTMNLTK